MYHLKCVYFASLSFYAECAFGRAEQRSAVKSLSNWYMPNAYAQRFMYGVARLKHYAYICTICIAISLIIQASSLLNT